MKKSSQNTAAYRPEVDGLRAIAVLAVVFYHAFPNWLKGGFIGVDIFFVISGFLITGHIFQRLDEGTFSFTDFFGRRIRRIFPALSLIMAFSLVAGFFILFSGDYALLGKHVASGAGFIINFELVKESGYFDSASETKPLLHLWSLSVEEQFYIIWPIILWVSWRRNKNLLKVTFFVAAASFLLNILFIESNPVETFFWPLGRFWELLSGSVIAWLGIYKKGQIAYFVSKAEKFVLSFKSKNSFASDGSITANLSSLIGLLLIIFGIIKISDEFKFPGIWALVPVIGAILIISAGSKALLNRALLMNPLLVAIGLISYPLYLWHWPILSLINIYKGEAPGAGIATFAILLSFLLAWLTYFFIERPIRRKGNWFFKTLVSASAIIILFLVGFIFFITDANIVRLSSPRQSVADTVKMSPKEKECHFPSDKSYKLKKTCIYFGSKNKVAVVGNSHAVELTYALAKKLEKYDIGVTHHTISACPHNYGVTETDEFLRICSDWHSEVMDSLKKKSSIDTVILSYRNEGSIAESKYRNSLIKMLKELSMVKEHVILVLQAPMPQTDIKNYIRKSVFEYNSTVFGRNLKDWRKLYKESEKLVNDLPASVLLLDPADLFCDDSRCMVIKNGEALYYDDNHISIKGAELISDKIMILTGFNRK